jgi:hypothetical protein
MRLPDLKSDAGVTPVGIALFVVLLIVAAMLGLLVKPILWLIVVVALLCLIF